jgi:hypothetical protein
MTYMDKTFGAGGATQGSGSAGDQPTRAALIVVVEDNYDLSGAFRPICECLGVAVERLPTNGDLASSLRQRSPMAVVAEMDAAGQDGCHVLMTVAAHDRDLPVMLISGGDPALLGAIDAVEEIWQLTSVVRSQQLPGVGAIVDFLFRAGRRGNCMRLMPS